MQRDECGNGRAPGSPRSLRGYLGSRLWPYAVLIVLLLGGGLWLATHRIFQVDEVQNMHMSWLLTQRDSDNYYNSAEVYMIPLALVSRLCQTPVAFFITSRIIFFVLFAASLFVTAFALSEHNKFHFAGALFILLSAPIFWDYGFEVRHDNIVILGMSLMILMLFRAAKGSLKQRMFWGGLTGGFLLLSSLKSVVLWAPVLGYMIAVQARHDRRAFSRAIAASLAGFGVSLAIAFSAHGLQGSLLIYIKGIGDFARTLATGQIRFFDWNYLWRFMTGHPLITLSSAAFLLTCSGPVAQRWARGDAFRDDDRRAKELLLLLLGIAFLAVNPTPFPYNYLYIALLASPAAFHLMARALEHPRSAVSILALGVIAAQGVIWATQTSRHLSYRNDGQNKIVEFLNDYTDQKDCVFDGVGLAIYRRGPERVWYLHSLSQPRYLAGDIPSVRDVLTSSVCPVLIESYKWQYMLPEDLAFIRSRYISHGRFIWILGGKVHAGSPGSYAFDIHKDGFYLVSLQPGAPSSAPTIDGVPMDSHPIHLKKGGHILVTDCSLGTVQLEWVKDSSVLRVAIPSISEPIFVNWY